MKGTKVIFLDLDGVVFDFSKAAFAAHGFSFDGVYPDSKDDEDFCVSSLIGITKSEFWSKIDALGHEFWARLEKYSHSQELIDLVKSYDEFILLTAPSDSYDCEKGKKIAIKELFGSRFKNYIFTPKKNKKLLAYVPGAVLIDDTPQNCTTFIETGGKAILFPEHRNKNRNIIDKVGYVKAELDKIYNKCIQ